MNNQYEIRNTQVTSDQNGALALDINLLQISEQLIDLLRSLPCKVNVIPYNEIGGKYNRPKEDKIHAFLHSLKHAPFTVTVRWSKGTDIDAGCGQLAVKDLA